MIVKRVKHGYSNKRKYVQGAGFFDTLKSIGSYISQNKDLIAKPLLGAVGNLGALGIEKGIPELISYIKNKKKEKSDYIDTNRLSPSGVEILNSILKKDQNPNNDSIPVSNIIGNGSGRIKKF